MAKVFEGEYAEAYDSLYREKDYAAECAVIEGIMHRYSNAEVATILDLGCGTGGHAIELARRGLRVVGVDRSPSMLRRARSKATGAIKGSVDFKQGDIRDFALEQEFDSAIMMFAVLGYMTGNADVIAALKATRRHLRPGSMFIFDCWYGPAVLSEGPSQRVKIIEEGEERIVRVATGSLDTARGVCRVDYRLWTLRGTQLVAEALETHEMRYFFKPELELLLSIAGFELLRLGDFSDLEREPDASTWNVLGAARALPNAQQDDQAAQGS